MTATSENQAPVELARYEFERLVTFIEQANEDINSVGARQWQHTNRFEEIQRTLDLHSGKYDRMEENLRRQDKALETILELLRRAQPANGK